MTKQEKANWQTRKAAEDHGYDPQPWQGCHIHSNNTATHEFVKFCLCYVLDQMGRDWDTEVPCDDGRVDVFDFGPADGKSLVYEVETDVTDTRKREKVNQYQGGPVRDVIVIDPADVPNDLESAISYLQTNVVVGDV